MGFFAEKFMKSKKKIYYSKIESIINSCTEEYHIDKVKLIIKRFELLFNAPDLTWSLNRKLLQKRLKIKL